MAVKKFKFTQSFSELKLNAALQARLDKLEFTRPLPIQARGLLPLLQGKNLQAKARTGTGKTLLFAIPAIHGLLTGKIKRALILAPTRELVQQVHGAIADLLADIPEMEAALIIGGKRLTQQLDKARTAQILCLSPGRAAECVDKGVIKRSEFDYYVVDEADKMLEEGNIDQVRQVLQTAVPENSQFVFSSATYSDELRGLCKEFAPDLIRLDVSQNVENAAEITEWAVDVYPENHLELTLAILKLEEPKQCLIFVNHRERVNELSLAFKKAGYKTMSLHGELDRVQREKAMESIHSGDIQILVATDLASRGIDIEGLPMVVNYDLPYDLTDYVHRAGRTARAGKKGLVVNYYNGKAVRKIRHIEEKMGRKMQMSKYSKYVNLLNAAPKAVAGKSLSIRKAVRITMRTGREHGLTQSGLRHILAKQCDIDTVTEVSHIDVRPRVTLFGVAPGKVDVVMKALQGFYYKGQNLDLSVSQVKSASPGNPRHKMSAKKKTEKGTWQKKKRR